MNARFSARGGVAALALAAWLLAPGASAFAQGADNTVTMGSETFDRTEVHVAPGQTIVWNNQDTEVHTVTADDGSFDSGDLASADQFTRKFDAPGTFPYYCVYHGGPGGDGMSGVIVVDG